MQTFLVYLKLELKRALKNIPYFLAGAIVLTVLLGTIAFSAGRMLYGGKALGQIEVGVILPKEDALAQKAVSMLSSLDSVGSLCNFTYVEEEEGKKLLRQGKIYALMAVPKNFVQGIMNGSNLPVTLIFPKNAGLEASVLRELTSSGAETLGVAQAAIYAADEFCYLTGNADSIKTVEDDLNRIYMKYALSRTGYFKEQKVSASGDIPVESYYAISAAVLFLLLCGIPAANLLRPKETVMMRKLSLIGIGRVKTIVARLMSVFILIVLASMLFFVPFLAFGLFPGKLTTFALWLLVCLSASTIILFFYELAGGLMAGVMLLFLASVGMVFLSGGFVPTVFLPEGIRTLSGLMPTTVIMDVMKGMVTGGSLEPVLKLCIMEAAVLVLTAAVRRQYE